jgi:putative transposase
MLARRPRLRTFDYLGKYRYFLTFTTHDRNELFRDATTVDLVQMHILRSAERRGFAICVYCYMPDHVHLLAEGLDENSDCREFVKLAKQTSAFAYSQTERRRLWQPSYYDHVLRHDESSLHFIAYILRNPVVKNLAPRCQEYPFVGAPASSLETITAMLREVLGPGWETEDTFVFPTEAGLKACATPDPP